MLLAALLISFTSLVINPNQAKAETLDIQAESAILIDAETGKILFQKNADLLLPPASMTKMMTEYLVMEAIAEGEISWDTTTLINDYPYWLSSQTSSSGIGLIQDKAYTVRQLYEAMGIISDNATTVALAELIAGSEGAFVEMMNQKAKEMGLPEYDFVNSTGLPNSYLEDYVPAGADPNGDDMLSARSAALLAYHLVNDYPEALEISSTLTSELDGRQLENLNWMLPWEGNNFVQYGYPGVDGLKTGYTSEAGYCFTGTAERDGRRLISVVMKTGSQGERFIETKKLLEYGFSQFTNTELYPTGYQIEDESVLPVAKGKEEQVEIEANNSIFTTIKTGDEANYSVKYTMDETKLNKDGELTAPIEKGEKVGTMELVYNGDGESEFLISDQHTLTVDVITTSGVEKSNWFMLTMGAIGNFFSNIFTTVADTVSGWFS